MWLEILQIKTTTTFQKGMLPEDVDYFHCTSNNTIFGTQIKDFPKVPSLMVCDMSSDILVEIDVSNFDLIYAGAQKKMGQQDNSCTLSKCL